MRGIWRYLRALGYMLTGRFTAAADALQSNPHVMAATYDTAIEKSQERFHRVRDGVAAQVAIEKKRIEEIKTRHAEADKCQNLKAGAQIALQRVVDALRGEGKTKEEIQQHPDYIKYSASFKSAVTELEAKNSRITELEADLVERRKQIAVYKGQLQDMQRDLEKLKEEKHEALADVAIADQQKAINDVLAGVAEDTVDKDLVAVREARNRANAEAQVSAEIAGNDSRLAENELLELAATNAADKELDSVLNWGEDASPKLEDAKLSE